MLEGESTYTFPYGSQIQSVEVYSKGQLISQTIYDVTGMPQHAVVNSNDEIRTMTTWYPNGSPKSIERYDHHLLITGDYYTSDNQRDSWIYDGNGERITRDSEGNCISLDTYSCGQLVLKTHYYPSGHPMEIAQYMDGVLHGERKTFYQGGEPTAIETWNLGQQSGTTVTFQNGEKYAEIPYLANKKNGLERRFRDGSIVTQEITWHDNQMHGPTFTYTGDNETMICDWFYKGRLTSKSNYDSFALPSALRRE
jgi:antitoxin component YwqK of YwqJK toxin-antitoxin module